MSDLVVHEGGKPKTVPPKTIASLMREHNLLYPFIVQKIASPGVSNVGVLLPLFSMVTIMKRIPSTINHSDDLIFDAYVGTSKYQLVDSPSWMLIEASDNNVLPMHAFKKHREDVLSRKRSEKGKQ